MPIEAEPYRRELLRLGSLRRQTMPTPTDNVLRPPASFKQGCLASYTAIAVRLRLSPRSWW
jgi:hypothetical protein